MFHLRRVAAVCRISNLPALYRCWSVPEDVQRHVLVVVSSCVIVRRLLAACSPGAVACIVFARLSSFKGKLVAWP